MSIFAQWAGRQFWEDFGIIGRFLTKFEEYLGFLNSNVP